jgi:predicted nucleic acid-binding protein
MRILVDTNILGRLSQAGHPMQPVASHAAKTLLDQGHELRTVPQVLYEYWAIATRLAEENGIGLTIAEAQSRLDEFKILLPPLRDERGILEPWEELVVNRQVRGKPTHDARLVAAMQRHSLTHLLTFTVDDFKRFPEIKPLHPSVVAGAAT